MKFAVTLLSALLLCACGAAPYRGSYEGAARARVELRNDTGHELCHLYVSRPGAREHSADLLDAASTHTHTIHVGERATVYLPAGEWDVLATSCDGDLHFAAPRARIALDAVLRLEARAQ